MKPAFTNYRILEEIGQGGMATVYLAEHQTLGTKVAIKVLNTALVHQDNIRKRFLAEARNMARMSHPHVIKVTDLIEEGETVAFVMEYIDGETLKVYLDRKGKLNDAEIQSIFTQMLEAVSYVHAHQLVHRDIKPSNFMLDKDGKVKLMDFGIAKMMDATAQEYTHTGTGAQMGTPMYMSPEQIKSTKDVTFQSDIYSLGVLLWQMVSGEKPYNGETLSTFDIQLKIVQEPLALTHTKWDNIIQRATEKEIQNRFIDVDTFKKVFDGSSDTGDATIMDNKLNTSEKADIDNRNFIEKEKIFSNLENPGSTNEYKNASLQLIQLLRKRNLFIILTMLIVAFALLLAYYMNSVNNNSQDKSQHTNFLTRDSSVSRIDSFDFVKIGDQTWMTQNLNLDTFRNGDIIPEVRSQKEWDEAGKNRKPAWCYYNNDTSNGVKYGKLYNWYAVNDTRGLAPRGWHIPEKEEWIQLDHFYQNDLIWKKIKSNKIWNSSCSGTNESGFEALPAGVRSWSDYGFSQLGEVVFFWSSTSINSDFGYTYLIGCNVEKNVKFIYPNKNAGLSVRCIRD
jgi:uncharacterized protein (TIGR02145 family)